MGATSMYMYELLQTKKRFINAAPHEIARRIQRLRLRQYPMELAGAGTCIV